MVRPEALEEILQRHPVWRGGALARAAEALPSGFAGLDAELPGGGWPRQGLTEVLADEPGIGELELILPALAALTGTGKRVVWVAPPYIPRSEEHTSELQSHVNLVCRLLLEKK